MRGLINYTVPVDTPKQGIYQMKSPYAAGPKPWANTALAGSVTEIYLQYYMSYDYADKSHRKLNRASSGAVEIMGRTKEEVRDVVIPRVMLDRSVGKVNDFAIYKALNDAADAGSVLTFYPDVDAFPAEFVSCVLRDFKNPQRESALPMFTFSLRLLILPNLQAPATIPAYV